MKQRPILFNTEMVRAILAGRKTQTRRVLKFQDLKRNPDNWYKDHIWSWRNERTGLWTNDGLLSNCPYGKKGDVLWVRETLEQSVTGGALYRAGGKVGESLAENEFLNWDDFSTTRKVIPSIHMPKDAARIWLRITDVRVERLQDISGIDALYEGITPTNIRSCSLFESWGAAKKMFSVLWQSINGTDSWNANPWVWVIEFERIEKP